MIPSKPLFIRDSVSLPDYESLIRKQRQTLDNQNSDTFAQMLSSSSQENESHSQATSLVETKKTTPEVENSVTEKPIGIPLHSSGIEILTKRPIGITPTAMMLDSQSLQILTRLTERKSSGLRLTTQEDFIESAKLSQKTTTAADYYVSNNPLGKLSAKYESGTQGISAIGYDRVGGTSYGKYQIASKVGTFNDFINFLETEAPDIAEQLTNAGTANTGSRSGAVPEAWKEVAASDPKRFGELQEEFIKKTHYNPAYNSIKDTGIDTDSEIIKQVVWSTAVQHGATGAKRIFDQALKNIDTLDEKSFITEVYELRANQFSSSSSSVRSSVQNRLIAEKNDALKELA